MIIQDQITPTGQYWENITPEPTHKQRNKEQFKHIVYPIPKEKPTRNLPNGVTNSVTERNLWLGGTTIDSMPPEINLSQYEREVRKYNTKGYRIIPYSRRLK